MNRDRRVTGLAIAAAAAALFVGSVPSIAADSGDVVKVRCYGANACKGQAECKTSMNACKGQNACKGHGFQTMSEKACLAQFGRS